MPEKRTKMGQNCILMGINLMHIRPAVRSACCKWAQDLHRYSDLYLADIWINEGWVGHDVAAVDELCVAQIMINHHQNMT